MAMHTYSNSRCDDSGSTNDVVWIATTSGWIEYHGGIGSGSEVDVITDKDLSDMGIK